MITLYGIKNCDTMKKAFTWLDQHGIDYQFHDYKKEGISKAHLQKWLQHLDMWKLINTKGTTWKQIPEDQKASVQDLDSAAILMEQNTSVIKRPVVELPNGYLLGFQEEEWNKTFIR